MKRLTIIAALVLSGLCALAQNPTPVGDMYLRPLQQRDSALVADQFEFGMVLEHLTADSSIQLPDMTTVFNDTLSVLGSWRVDTLFTRKQLKARMKGADFHPVDVRASLVIVPWEPGHYQLPDIPVVRASASGTSDTLLYKAPELEVCAIPIDTATFQIHDIKDQIRYPVTPAEILPYVVGINLLALVSILVVALVMMRKRKDEDKAGKEPAYITALRNLDRYRGDKFWAPDKQKTMYSGITDTLRTYIESRFEVNAEEMTTAEIFDRLKGCEDITPELYADVRALFELSDFVKFAKHTAGDEENANAIPTAVRFVTMTYQTQLDQEAAEAEKEDK